jgi:hypothetical protein
MLIAAAPIGLLYIATPGAMGWGVAMLVLVTVRLLVELSTSTVSAAGPLDEPGDLTAMSAMQIARFLGQLLPGAVAGVGIWWYFEVPATAWRALMVYLLLLGVVQLWLALRMRSARRR